mmetsp:Transcript_145537/g.256606  ORF Transcript_145537/g.256606 Transcript_145537/m.256606 type:complete len:264 (-) Transcript_145537:179-970(-)
MRTLALALGCLAFTGNGRRIHTTQDKADSPQSMNKFASLLLASGTPGAAWQAATAGPSTNHFAQKRTRTSPVSMRNPYKNTPKDELDAFQDPDRWGELVKVDENFLFEEAIIPDLTPTARILSNLQDKGILSQISELGLLSKAEEGGLFSSLESAGAFSKLEQYLPLVDDLELLELAQQIVDEELPLVPASGALLAVLPAWIAAVVLGGISEPIPLVLTGLVALLAGVAGGAGLALNAGIEILRDNPRRTCETEFGYNPYANQ